MNLPNKLTVFRVILIPFCIYFLMFSNLQQGALIALILFVVASFTDFLDGYIARRDNLVTDFGKLMDPLADKLLVTSVLIGFIALDMVPAVVVMLIIAREFIVTSLRLIASNKGVVIAADVFGKIKTVLQMVFLINGMALLYVAGLDVLHTQILVWLKLHELLMVAMTVMTLLSGWNYIYKNRTLFLADR